MAQRVVVACAVAALSGCSPYGGGEFACTTDDQCGAGGKCAAGFCAFPDPNCTDSGFRYGELSGPQSGQCVGGNQPADAAVDTPDSPPGMSCYGMSGLVTACFASPPTGTQTFTSTQTINTDSSNLCATTLTNQVDACVIAAQTITVNGGIFVSSTGSKPLVLVATQTITINGFLGASSSRQFGVVGAGVDMAGCNAGTLPTGTSGGAGGSFGGVGGNGAAVGTAGTAGAALTVTKLRGGCSGQQGADDVAPIDPGGRGRGGGAIYLIADTSITVAGTGVLSAAGASGQGGGASASAGAGGGGSGGFIGLDTPTIMNSGSIFANGGAGGEGSGTGSTGNDGQDATLAGSAAIGGNAGSNYGTDGGNGSVGTTLTGSPAAAVCTLPCTTPGSGGGGGGGAGIIKHYRAGAVPGTVSPPAT